MSVEERDPETGHRTTGHDWNGIKELNTRVPRAVWWAIGITHVWALAVWLLLPAWPLGETYTEGLLGVDQRELVAGEIEAGQRFRAHWVARFDGESLTEVRADDTLVEIVRGAGPALWEDNCGVCHGRFGRGGPGFPNVVDEEWLWGGSDAQILEMIRVGVNSQHPETFISQMPAFDGVLSRDEIGAVIAYVQSFSAETETAPETLEQGAQIFLDNCASCHGEDAMGIDEIGAPNLTDAAWIYGGDDETMLETLLGGRMGWMPGWEGRITDAEIKMLAVYLLDVLPERAP
ncbi:cytochrome-c oxidase, cbb3-type subunit III [Roseicyclus sp.]|uniref:cytochrome-c oxidase, cbb3-type subunit III n=1 Tax=Roseicyclus sp. TaxID=1914329 RepID=UPI003F9F8833